MLRTETKGWSAHQGAVAAAQRFVAAVERDGVPAWVRGFAGPVVDIGIKA